MCSLNVSFFNFIYQLNIFISGMITHGDFMLTLFSFALFFVFLFSCLCATYSTVSYFPYYVHKMLVSFYHIHLYKSSTVSFQSCFTFLQNYQNLLSVLKEQRKRTSIYYILDDSSFDLRTNNRTHILQQIFRSSWALS